MSPNIANGKADSKSEITPNFCGEQKTIGLKHVELPLRAIGNPGKKLTLKHVAEWPMANIMQQS